MIKFPKKEKTPPVPKKNRPWWKRILRVLGRSILILFILFILLVLFIRSPWGQDIVVGKITTYISSKTNTKISIEKLFITFSGDIELRNLYLEDKKQDTLIFSEQLLVEIPIWPIITGNPISIDGLEWKGLRANIVREDSITGFNYQFLIDAFASDSASTQTEEESSKPLKISVGSVNLSDFKVNYKDGVSGTIAKINLGDFYFEGKDLDIEKMKFQVAQISLENTNLEYIQTKKTPSSEPSETTLPYLSLDNLKLNNVVIHYKSAPDSIDAQLNLADLILQVPKADLAHQDIKINQFSLSNSIIKVKLSAQKETDTQLSKNKNTSVSSTPFLWPNWNINVNSIALENNHIKYQISEKSKNTTGFNPDYIVLNGFNLKANDISLSKNKSAKINLEDLYFSEESGLDLSQLSFSAEIDSTSFSVNKLILKTGNNSINTDLGVKYASIQSFINEPEDSPLFLDLKNFTVDVNDVFILKPALRKNEYLKKLAKHKLTGQVKASGKLSELNLSIFLVNWGGNTKITTQGKFHNLSNFDNIIADIDQFTFNSNQLDLNNFVSEKELGISIPKTVILQAQLKGKLDDFKTIVLLTIPEGKVIVNAQLKQKNEISFNTEVNVLDLNLGKILKNPTIGKVDFKMQASGNGKTINDLNATLASNFSKLELSGYDFSALKLDGKLNNGDGDITLKYKDDNLDLAIDSKIQLDSISPKIVVDFKLQGADLFALGLTEKQIRAKLMMNANFKGNSDKFDFDSHFSEGIAIYDGSNYYLGDVDLSASVCKDSMEMDINSNFLNGNLRANAGIDKTISAVRSQLENYFTDSTAVIDSIIKPVKLQISMKLSETDLITEFFVPEIKAMDTLNFKVYFNQKEKNLTANLNLPYFDYAGNTIDSLQFNLNSDVNDAKFKLGFNKLEAGPLMMNHTYLDGDFKSGLLNLHFHALDGEKELYVVESEISGKTSDLKIHLNPEKLIINSLQWTIPAENELSLNKERIIAKDFVLSNNGQSLKLANDLIQDNQDNIGVEFNNFKLDNLLALFNKNDLLAAGDLQGNIVAVNPKKNLALMADFNINNLSILQTTLGKLSLKANAKNNDSYTLNVDMKGEDIDFVIKGDYGLQNLGSELDFKLNLNKIGMKTIASLSGESLVDASGNFSGEIVVQGNVNSPDYKGFIQFNDAIVKVTDLNSIFQLSNDKINIDNTAITLNQFSIQDEQKNTFMLDGSILTENMTDPAFDLKIKSNNFQVINSSKKDNEVYYGSLNFSMDGTITGKMSAPIANINIGINENTDFTYVLQNSQAKLEKTEGIVEFVNKSNPNDILTRTNNSDNIEVFGGIELHTRLKIDKDAKFNVIIDPKTGDNLNISGEGDLNFNIEKNGLTTLSGRYDINKGSYSLSLYNLVKRKFELEKGSSVVWRGGSPTDAELNVTAKYYIETSASALMASQTSGSSEEIRNKYRQKLPFLVYLNVKGELNQPELSFNLGMPEDSRGAIDGTVYGKIKQLNNEEDELNKQVFSLLVLEKFYPNSGSDGSNGGAASLVRTNINDALSDQLNAFSGKLTGNTGIELDFGLNSYTDYQGESTQQRTDLNISAKKKLFDDRLIVQVGSDVNVEGNTNPGEENPVVGNVSIAYMLTKDGNWRLKGFRNSEYENVIDGQVFVNGISLIFQRQFNKFHELLNAPKENEESIGDKKNDKAEENMKKKPKTDKN